MLSLLLRISAHYLNKKLDKYTPSEIIAITLAIIGAIIAAKKAYGIHQHWDTKQIRETLINNALITATKLPFIGNTVTRKIKNEVTLSLSSFKKETDSHRTQVLRTLPTDGTHPDELAKLYPHFETTYPKGKMSGTVYTEYSPELLEVLKQLYADYALTNPLHGVFSDLKKKEAEVISWCIHLFNGSPGAHGIITAGGTLSIFEACKSYVFLARKKGITNPEIIVPSSSHPAFAKSAEILNAVLRVIPINEKTGQADVAAMQAAINSNTCMMVAAGMSYPFGVIDPIQELAKICRENTTWLSTSNPIPLHVDSCLGGFLTAFTEKAGYSLPICDFRIKGVESISADIHKYGDGPKGSSILLMRRYPNRLLQPTPTHTFLTSAVGSYITPGLPGSRTGVQVATAHAVMLFMGENGYVQQTKNILNLRQQLVDRIKGIDGVILPYNAQLSVVGIRTNANMNPIVVAEKMQEKGWELNCLLTPNYQPDGFHFCLTAAHTTTDNFVENFSHDLQEAVTYVKSNPNQKPKGIAKAYGVLATGFVPTMLQDIIGDVYTQIDQSLPGNPIPGFFDDEKSARYPC